MSKHPPNVLEDCDVLGLLAFPGNSDFIVCSDDKKLQFIGTSELLWEGGAVFMRRKIISGWGRGEDKDP